MENHFNKISNTESLVELWARSRNEAVVLFKHSLTCPISAAAHEEMLRFGGDVALVEVQKAREVSREIEERTGIEHESPQVIILGGGTAVWSASHFDVRAEKVAEAVRKHNSDRNYPG